MRESVWVTHVEGERIEGKKSFNPSWTCLNTRGGHVSGTTDYGS